MVFSQCLESQEGFDMEEKSKCSITCLVEDCKSKITVRLNQDKPSRKNMIYGDHDKFVPSSKLTALLQHLKEIETEAEEKGDDLKSIIFSQFTATLDLIEVMLTRESMVFVRLDGTMTHSERMVSETL